MMRQNIRPRNPRTIRIARGRCDAEKLFQISWIIFAVPLSSWNYAINKCHWCLWCSARFIFNKNRIFDRNRMREPAVFKSIANYFVRWMVMPYIYEAIIRSYSVWTKYVQKMLAFRIQHANPQLRSLFDVWRWKKNDPVIITVWSERITAFFSLSLLLIF